MRSTNRFRPLAGLWPLVLLPGLVLIPALAAQEAVPPGATSTATLPGFPGSFFPASRAHVPVVLVPGWNDRAEDLVPLRRRFLEAGWPGERVLALEFEDPVGSNVEHAGEIATAVEALLERTGASAVDVVAHSMGGLAVRKYLMEGSRRVRKVVFLGTPHRGTMTAYLAWGEGGEEMQPGAEFLMDLNRAFLPHRNVRTMAIRTPMDLRVIPGESAELPGAVNREICCPTHRGLIDDPETFQLVRGFLDERWTSVPIVAGEGGEDR